MESLKQKIAETTGRQKEKIDRGLDFSGVDRATEKLQATFTAEERNYFDKLKVELLELFAKKTGGYLTYEEIKLAENAELLKKIADKLEQIQRFVQDRKIPRDQSESTVDSHFYSVDLSQEKYRQVIQDRAVGVPLVEHGRFVVPIRNTHNTGRIGINEKGEVTKTPFFWRGRILLGGEEKGQYIFRSLNGDIVQGFSGLQVTDLSLALWPTDKKFVEIAGEMCYVQPLGNHRYEMILNAAGQGVSAAYDRIDIPREQDGTFLLGTRLDTGWRRALKMIGRMYDYELEPRLVVGQTLLHNGQEVGKECREIREPMEFNGSVYYIGKTFWGEALYRDGQQVGERFKKITQVLKTDKGIFFVAEKRFHSRERYVYNHEGRKIRQDLTRRLELFLTDDGSVYEAGTENVTEDSVSISEIAGKHLFFRLPNIKMIKKIKQVGTELYITDGSVIFKVDNDTILDMTVAPRNVVDIIDFNGQPLFIEKLAGPRGVGGYALTDFKGHKFVRGEEIKQVKMFGQHLCLAVRSQGDYRWSVCDEKGEVYDSYYGLEPTIEAIDDDRFYVVGRRGAAIVKDVFTFK